MLLMAVHDVTEPQLDLGGDGATSSIAPHRDVDNMTTMVNLRNRTDKIL